MLRALMVVLLGICGCAVPSGPAPEVPAAIAPAARGAAAFGAAYASFRAGDMSEAQVRFRSLLGTDPVLADYHLYFLGMSAAYRGDVAEATAALRALIDGYPESVVRPEAQLELGRKELAVRRLEEAERLLQPATESPRRQTVLAARTALGETREAMGDDHAAVVEYMAVRHAAPRSTAAQSAKRRLLALRAAHRDLQPTGEAALAEARLCLAEGDAPGAERWAAQTAAAGLGNVRTAAVSVQADALVRQQRIDDGVALLRSLASDYPTDPAAPAALVRAATVLWNRDRDREARLLFEEVLQRYPGDPRAGEALYAIGRIEQASQRHKEAAATFARLAATYPTSTRAAEARWRIGWLHYTAGNWPAAVAAFAEAATGDTETSGRYWQARSLERGGNHAAAASVYRSVLEREPDGYYAMWAEARLADRPTRPDITAAVPPPRAARVEPPPPAPDEFGQKHRFHAYRWFALHRAGVDNLARGEIDAIRQASGNDPSTAELLIPAYASVDAHSTVLELLRQPGVGWSLSVEQRRRFQYPLAYWRTLREASAASGVDPLLVLAIMRQESRFDPEARSPADAYGLLQLLPSTAARVAARDPSLPQPDTDRLADPSVNIPIAVAYLAQLLNDANGDVFKATAAYNGGETAVARWERRFATLPPDEFVESITYRETRDYVKRVIGNYRAYRRLWGPSSNGQTGLRSAHPGARPG